MSRHFICSVLYSCTGTVLYDTTLHTWQIAPLAAKKVFLNLNSLRNEIHSLGASVMKFADDRMISPVFVKSSSICMKRKKKHLPCVLTGWVKGANAKDHNQPLKNNGQTPNNKYFGVYVRLCAINVRHHRETFSQVFIPKWTMRPVRPVWLSLQKSDTWWEYLPHPHTHTHVTVNQVRPSCAYTCVFLTEPQTHFWASHKHSRFGIRQNRVTKMPTSICGSWEMISNVNFEGYMIALGKSGSMFWFCFFLSSSILRF